MRVTTTVSGHELRKKKKKSNLTKLCYKNLNALMCCHFIMNCDT
jgi:hypothetical protein